jgi:hypothetical protein
VLALQEQHLKMRSALTFLQSITRGSPNGSSQVLQSAGKRKAPSTSTSESGAMFSGAGEKEETLVCMGGLEAGQEDGFPGNGTPKANKRRRTDPERSRSAKAEQAATWGTSKERGVSTGRPSRLAAVEQTERAGSVELVGASAGWAERAEGPIETLAEFAHWGRTNGSEPWATRLGQPRIDAGDLPWPGLLGRDPTGRNACLRKQCAGATLFTGISISSELLPRECSKGLAGTTGP